MESVSSKSKEEEDEEDEGDEEEDDEEKERIIEIIYNDEHSSLSHESNENKNENDDDENSSILTPFEETEEEIIVEFDEVKNAVEEIRLLLDEADSIKSEDLNIEISDTEPNFYNEYKEKCLELNLPPVKALENVLLKGDEVLDLQSYKIDNANLFFMCQTLIGPPAAKIRYLNLRNTQLNEEACSALSELLELNYHLKMLNLENCQIGEKGINILKDGIHLSQGISYLNLSNCDLKDSGGVIVARMLAKNDVCKSVDLSRNHLHVLTAAELNFMFKENITLEALNLKWNDFYPETEASVKLLNGLQKNESLKELDLSWNGISGNQFAKSLVKVFRYNTHLKKINLENNYLQPENIRYIALGLKNAKALEEIYIGNNFTTPEMQIRLIKSAENSKNLKILSLGNDTWIESNVYNLAQDVMRKKPNFQIIFKDKLYPNPPEPVDFRSIIIDRAKYSAMKPKKKKLKKDLGHFMLKLQEHSSDNLKEDEFIQLIKDSKMKLDDDLIKHLVDEFSYKIQIGKRKTEKRVQIKEMSTYYLSKYPTEPPLPKIKKEKKKKKKTKTKKK